MLAQVCLKRFPLISEVTVRGTQFYHVSGITLMLGPKFLDMLFWVTGKKKPFQNNDNTVKITVCYGKVTCWTWMFWQRFSHSFWVKKGCLIYRLLNGTGKCDYCENFCQTDLKMWTKAYFLYQQICDTFCMEDHRDIWGCRFSMNLVYSAWTFCKV